MYIPVTCLLLGNIPIKTSKEENKTQFFMDGDINYFTKLKIQFKNF